MNGTAYPGLTTAEVAERVRRGQVNRTPQSRWAEYGGILSRNVFTLFNALVKALIRQARPRPPATSSAFTKPATLFPGRLEVSADNAARSLIADAPTEVVLTDW